MKRKDVEQLRELIAQSRSVKISMIHPERIMVSDWYNDYRSGKAIPKPMAGYDDGQTKYKELEKELRELNKRIDLKVQEIEAWLDSLEHRIDPMMYAILRNYYRNGMSQEDIGLEVGYAQSSVHNKIEEFWTGNKH